MGYLIDTNIISELSKSKPNKKFLDWFASVNDIDIFVSVLTIGEITKGINLLADGNKRQALNNWLAQDLIPWLDDRLIVLDLPVINTWGILQAKYKKSAPVIDSLLASTAIYNELILVTRNVQDFVIYQELKIINPIDH